VVWHGDQVKRKSSGGKKKAYRGKRAYERGRYPVETGWAAEEARKVVLGKGGIQKVKIAKSRYANVARPGSGKVVRTEILEIIRNPANMDYNRRRILTRGTIVRTELGNARVISRPGQDGVVNAILVEEQES